MTEVNTRSRSRTQRVDKRPRQRTESAQRALDRRNRRLARAVRRTTGAAVRNGMSSSSQASGLSTNYRGKQRSAVIAELQAKPSRWRVGKLSFAAAVLLVCFVGLGVALVLSSYVSSQSDSVVALQQTNKELKEHDVQLTKQLQESLSASQLADKAASMGMVPVSDVATLEKRGNRVIVHGQPNAAQGYRLRSINPVIPERQELTVEETSEDSPQPVAFQKRRTPKKEKGKAADKDSRAQRTSSAQKTKTVAQSDSKDTRAELPVTALR